jgi:hypothetical protein
MAVKALDTLLAIKVINLVPGLRQSDRRVGVALIEHFNRKTGRCDPSLGRIAGLLGYCTRTIIRSTQKLESIGLFQKVRHGGYTNRNSYEPNWPRFAELETAWKEKLLQNARSRQSGLSPAPGQPSHVADDKHVTQTCSTNQSQSTCSSGRPNKRMEAVEIRSNTNSFGKRSADAARDEAEGRWCRELNDRFRSKSVTYAEIIRAITPDIKDAATEAEFKQRGAGIAYVIKELKLG